MKTQQDYIDIERQYAEAIGWKQIEQSGHGLVGYASGNEPNSRSRRPHSKKWVPEWARSWNACGPLICKYAIEIHATEEYAVVECGERFEEEFDEIRPAYTHIPKCEHATPDDALRFAILTSALEQERSK